MKKEIIKDQINRAGKTVCLKDGSWTSVPFFACLSCLWRKKTSDFEPDMEQLGTADPEYYLYIGPYDHDITALTEDALVISNNEEYEFKNADAVMFGNEIIYYAGILKKIKGTDYDEDREYYQ